MQKEKLKYYINKYKNVYGAMIGTPIGRIQFVYLKSPQIKYQPPKYGVTILFDKSDAATKAALNKMIGMCNDMKEFAETQGVETDGFTVLPVQDGDDTAVSKYQGYAGNYFITARNAEMPEYVGVNGKERIDAAMFVAGVKCRAVVTPMIYDEGFSWKLHVVQFVADDGVRFYGGPDPKSLLSALGEEDNQEEVVASTIEAPAAAKATSTKKTGKAAAIDLL